MASITVDDVRDVINVSSAEVSDSKITKMVKRAEVTLELETDKEPTTPIAQRRERGKQIKVGSALLLVGATNEGSIPQ